MPVEMRSSMIAACLLLAMPLVHACAASIIHRPLPQLLNAASDSRVGGEALFEGELQTRDNCVIAVANGRAVLPIFDSTVSLNEAGDAIIDNNSGERVRIGERVRGAAAYLSEDGKGWNRSDIKSLIGVTVPDGCGHTIVRLRDIGRPEERR